MPRPTGVVVIAILYFVAAASVVLVAIGVMAGISTIGALSPEPRLSPLLAGLGAGAGVFLLLPAALLALIGWGLLRMKNWARVVTIVLAIVGLVGIFSGVALLGLHSPLLIAAALIRTVINAVIIWYLLRADVKRAFALP